VPWGSKPAFSSRFVTMARSSDAEVEARPLQLSTASTRLPSRHTSAGCSPSCSGQRIRRPLLLLDAQRVGRSRRRHTLRTQRAPGARPSRRSRWRTRARLGEQARREPHAADTLPRGASHTGRSVLPARSVASPRAYVSLLLVDLPTRGRTRLRGSFGSCVTGRPVVAHITSGPVSIDPTLDGRYSLRSQPGSGHSCRGDHRGTATPYLGRDALALLASWPKVKAYAKTGTLARRPEDEPEDRSQTDRRRSSAHQPVTSR